MQDETKTKLAVSMIACLPVVVKVGAETYTAWRQKQKAEKARKENERIALMNQAHERLYEMLLDPNITLEEYNQALYEEVQFMSLVDDY